MSHRFGVLKWKKIKSSNTTVINQNGHLLQTFDETSDTSSVPVGRRKKRTFLHYLKYKNFFLHSPFFLGGSKMKSIKIEKSFSNRCWDAPASQPTANHYKFHISGSLLILGFFKRQPASVRNPIWTQKYNKFTVRIRLFSQHILNCSCRIVL
jgi:hypothetical protein